MFSVITDLSVTIDGCPHEGVAAVDFRVANGLRPFPNNGVKVKVTITSEVICRKYHKYLDGEANLVLDRVSPLITTVNRLRLSAPVEMLSPFDNLSASEDDVARLVDHLAGKVELVATEQNRWIAKHGSERLRRLVAEGFEHYGVYFSERMKHDIPGWVERRECNDLKFLEPRNPPEYALKLLDESRDYCVGAKLVYWVDLQGDSGYAATGEFLGREVVLMESE